MSTSLATPFVPAQFTPVGAARPNQVDIHAKASGFTQGYNEGAAQARREAQQREQERAAEHADLMDQLRGSADRGAQALAAAVHAVSQVEVGTVEQVRAALHAAAIELAEVIVGRELSSASDSARAALERVASHPIAAQVIQVRMHPQEHAAAMELVERAGTTLPEQATLVADPTLAPGQVIATYPDGHLDASVSTALERARQALAGEDA